MQSRRTTPTPVRAKEQAYGHPFLTARAVQWLAHIDRHGPQSSIYLHALTQATHRCKDTSLRQIQKLREAGLLYRPAQQENTRHASFNPDIYEITRAGRDALFEHGREMSPIRPSGHWVHAYMIACATSAMEITAAKHRIRYLAAHQILPPERTDLSLTIGKRRCIPDQLFALDYGGAYRVCALEVDRSTEPKTSRSPRKSHASSIELYEKILTSACYKQHYGIRSNLLVLWVFASRRNQQRFLELVAARGGLVERSTLTQSVDGFHLTWRPPPVWAHLIERPWQRAKSRPVTLVQAVGRCPE